MVIAPLESSSRCASLPGELRCGGGASRSWVSTWYSGRVSPYSARVSASARLSPFPIELIRLTIASTSKSISTSQGST